MWADLVLIEESNMETILADVTVSVSEFKKNPAAVLRDPIAYTPGWWNLSS